MSRPLPCPCASGLPYAACCEPLHRGAREADSPTALMRSRYAAFARGEVEYLWRTLHPEHPDAQAPESIVKASIRESAQANRYTGLAILDARDADADGIAKVLFHARVFQKGRERSFVECSDFARDGGGWRYLRGVMRPIAQCPRDIATLTIDRFLALPA